MIAYVILACRSIVQRNNISFSSRNSISLTDWASIEHQDGQPEPSRS